MSLLVIVIIFSSINTSLFYCYGENGILNFGLLLFRPSVMIVAIVTLICIYVYRIIRHNCSTQTTSSHVMQAEAIKNTGKQSDVTSHLFEIPLFLLQVSLLMSHAPLLLRDWFDSFSSDQVGVALRNIIYLIYMTHFCGKFIVYASTLHIFCHNLLTLCKKPGLRHHKSTNNEAVVMTEM